MWIVNEDGFYSAVEHRDESDQIIVRARVKQDLRNLMLRMGAMWDIETDLEADYPYRVGLPREAWQQYLSLTAQEMHYDNFKQRVSERDKRRARLYTGVWGELIELEELCEELNGEDRGAAYDHDAQETF